MASPSPAPSDDTSGYDNTHRAFLHAFFSKSTLTLTTARPILARIFSAASTDPDRQTLENDITEADFLSYINAVNAAITPYDLEIRSTLPQAGVPMPPDPGPRAGGNGGRVANERIYALVNTTSDPQTQLATTHSADEIAYVKRLLDAMFDTYNGPVGASNGREVMAVTEMQATQLHRASARDRSSGVTATQRAQAAAADDDDDDEDGTVVGTQRAGGGGVQSITLGQAERMLKSLVDEGWLVRPTFAGANKEYYVLSSRALLELKDWLLQTYNEPAIVGEDGGVDEEAVERVKCCRGCNEVVMSGQRCMRKECGVRLHDRCVLAVMRAGRQGRRGGGEEDAKCPECGKEWTGTEFVGVRAVKDVRERYLREMNGTRRRSGTGAQLNGHNDADADGDEDE